jgi:hypothetical protein
MQDELVVERWRRGHDQDPVIEFVFTTVVRQQVEVLDGQGPVVR